MPSRQPSNQQRLEAIQAYLDAYVKYQEARNKLITAHANLRLVYTEVMYGDQVALPDGNGGQYLYTRHLDKDLFKKGHVLHILPTGEIVEA